MIITSLLDTDLYTFTVSQAILDNFRNVPVSFRFDNRKKHMKFTNECFQQIVKEINSLKNLSLTDDELNWMTGKFPFLSPQYLCWVKNLKLNPEKEVNIQLTDDGQLDLIINGDWSKTIFYEVPILAIISECYFKYVDKDWSYDGQYEQHEIKSQILTENECYHAEFGTRRRRSTTSQDLCIYTMKKSPYFVGTSNVYYAKKYNLKCVGTQSHQWFMGVSVLRGLRHCNHNAMYLWVKTYNAALGIALTDTFGTEAFFEDFDLKLAKTFDGVRHDSGDPFIFADKVVKHYMKLKIDPKTKTIVFSDGLSPGKAIDIKNHCEKLGIRVSFGIGTNFTNDYENSPALSIVIKLSTCEGIPVVKLSDTPEKAIGDPDALRVAKWTFFNTPLNKQK